MTDRHSAACAPPCLSRRLRHFRDATGFASADIRNQREDACALILSRRESESASRSASSFAGGYGGQVAGRGRREAIRLRSWLTANDRRDSGGESVQMVEGAAGKEHEPPEAATKRRREATSEQREWATSARPPPSVQAFSADARRPPPGGRRKRSTRPACDAQAARPSAAPCQARRPAGRGV